MNLSAKIYKLLKALNNRGHIYLYRRDQVWSYEMSKACSIYKIYRQWTVAEYMRDVDLLYKKKSAQKIVKKELYSSFRQIDIVLWLAARWKEVKDSEGKA